MKIAVLALVLFGVALVSAVTNVEKCPQGKTLDDYKLEVAIGNCKKPPCKLKKGRNVKVDMKFTPTKDIKKLSNTVNAIIVGLPFPFIGVDGTDACTQLFESDGTTKAACPLTKGKEYVYKNQFDILDIYPQISLKVHWALTTEAGEDAFCFETAARIIK